MREDSTGQLCNTQCSISVHLRPLPLNKELFELWVALSTLGDCLLQFGPSA